MSVSEIKNATSTIAATLAKAPDGDTLALEKAQKAAKLNSGNVQQPTGPVSSAATSSNTKGAGKVV